MNADSIRIIKENLQPISGEKKDYDSLIKLAKDARFVLIGESTHGTKEFYHIRAEITKRLIEEEGFCAVAIEGDWSDAYYVNRYVNHTNHNGGASHALSKFERFPTWMWQNKEVLSFIKWLHGFNLTHNKATRFYGLDLYGMHNSINAVISYLEKIDEAAAQRARKRYSCLDNFSPHSFKFDAIENSCEKEVMMQLTELRRKAFEYLKENGFVAEEEFFCAEQNALLVKDAQQYYRSLYYGAEPSWNIRDEHMAKTLDNLSIHLSKVNSKPAKIVVWAHNSHIGDARYTDMSKRSELNLGQLVREKYGDESLLIGFSTYEGTVSAAPNWDMPVERKTVIPALKDSVEYFLHKSGAKNFILEFRDNPKLQECLSIELLQRFIGVIYLPQSEYLSHYYKAQISKQFDALIYISETTAVEPLKVTPKWQSGEADDTYPFGM